jgi:hypothetical protein
MKKIKITESQLKRLVINEQLLKNVGDRIKTGVQNMVNKVVPNKEITIPGTSPSKGRNLEQLRTEWSKINQDTSNRRGYGEGVSTNLNAARTSAKMNADVAILKKMGKQQATFGSIIVDEATFQLENGNYINLVIIEPNNIQMHENQDVDERSRSFAFTRKKRLFSKAELMANPLRYRKYERDLKEIDRYKFSEPRTPKKPSPEEYKEVLSTATFLKKDGPISYFYKGTEEDYTPVVRFHIIDTDKKEYVGYADFEIRYGSEFFVSLPYIRQEYRNMGIATEIYKIALTMGSVTSGKAQSEQAVGLWKKMFNELTNNMVYIDDSGKEFGVYMKNGEIHTTKTDMSVYDTKGGYLRLSKSK